MRKGAWLWVMEGFGGCLLQNWMGWWPAYKHAKTTMSGWTSHSSFSLTTQEKQMETFLSQTLFLSCHSFKGCTHKLHHTAHTRENIFKPAISRSLWPLASNTRHSFVPPSYNQVLYFSAKGQKRVQMYIKTENDTDIYEFTTFNCFTVSFYYLNYLKLNHRYGYNVVLGR